MRRVAFALLALLLLASFVIIPLARFDRAAIRDSVDALKLKDSPHVD